jgi:hypothetical protein
MRCSRASTCLSARGAGPKAAATFLNKLLQPPAEIGWVELIALTPGRNRNPSNHEPVQNSRPCPGSVLLTMVAHEPSSLLLS